MKTPDDTNGIKVMTPRHFLYSAPLKAIAVILFTLSLVCGALFAVNTLSALDKEDPIIYEFEENFSDSRHLAEITQDPEMVLSAVYHNFYNEGSRADTVDGMNFEEYLNASLQDLYYIDQLDYYISVNGTVCTDCGAEEADDLADAAFYRHITIDENGHYSRNANPDRDIYYNALEEIRAYDPAAEIEIMTVITDDYAEECEIMWTRQETIVKEAIGGILGILAFALLLLSYLIFAAGKTKTGELKNTLLDQVWTEIHLAVILCAVIGVPGLIISLLNVYFYDQLAFYLVKCLTAGIAVLGGLVFLLSFLAIVRMVKGRRFFQRSIFFIMLRWVWNLLKDIFAWCRKNGKGCKNAIACALSQKSGRWLLIALFCYTALIGFMGVLTPYSGGVPLLLGVMLFGFAAAWTAYRAKDMDEIKKGAREIRRGRMNYAIPEPKSEDLKELAKDINDIAEGLDRSMEGRLKAERMKTELITNVSHDLKTPLTSIINYTTLLKEMEDLPEEAKDYIAVIAKKSEGLKNLTRDLFEISKVQSGNETFEPENLDAAQLIEQSLGEHDNEIQNSGLTFCVKTEKDLRFLADGRKMSRVMGNLIENALKYAMKNTRVFLEAYENGGYVTMEIKNTSAAPMDFDAEDITARFVRGDASRTDGGNGLGLAIAKSYTEGCGGTFRVILDGDLFKAVIIFPKN